MDNVNASEMNRDTVLRYARAGSLTCTSAVDAAKQIAYLENKVSWKGVYGVLNQLLKTGTKDQIIVIEADAS